MIKQDNISELLARISEFNVSSIKLQNNGILNISIKIEKNMDVSIIEKNIKIKFPEYIVQLMFFIDEPQQKNFKKIIGIGSGKGGVGKSMIALNLAFALKELGNKVGILDADIYSPSIAGLLGIETPPMSKDGNFIDPSESHGFQVLSMGLLLKDGQSQVWNDGTIAAIFNQFLLQSSWNCDYLIIDFAGGMNAAYNACTSVCPNIEMLMVSQPNKMIYRDVIRMYSLIKGLNLKVLGFIETMTDEFYPEESLSQLVDLKHINRLITIPFFNHYKEYIENTYPENYKLPKIEKEIVEKLIKQII